MWLKGSRMLHLGAATWGKFSQQLPHGETGLSTAGASFSGFLHTVKSWSGPDRSSQTANVACLKIKSPQTHERSGR